MPRRALGVYHKPQWETKLQEITFVLMPRRALGVQTQYKQERDRRVSISLNAPESIEGVRISGSIVPLVRARVNSLNAPEGIGGGSDSRQACSRPRSRSSS